MAPESRSSLVVSQNLCRTPGQERTHSSSRETMNLYILAVASELFHIIWEEVLGGPFLGGRGIFIEGDYFETE